LEKIVKLDHITLTAEDLVLEQIESKPTGNMLRHFKFVTGICGISSQRQIADILAKESFTFEIPSESFSMKAVKKNARWSFSGEVVNENTLIEYQIQIQELDKDLPEGWNLFGGMLESIVMNWIRTRATADILFEKGVVTRAEYEEKIHTIVDRDFENLRRYIMYGLPVDFKKKK
jgi:hypothetical protein